MATDYMDMPQTMGPIFQQRISKRTAVQDVNLAFGQAAESLPFQPLKYPATGNFSNSEIGSLGTVIHETTRILAKVCGYFI